jgi:hypothetical protein
VKRAPGAWAEVDWGEAEVLLAGARVTVHLFVMRACDAASFSVATLCQASLVETQQAFLELHAEVTRPTPALCRHTLHVRPCPRTGSGVHR